MRTAEGMTSPLESSARVHVVVPVHNRRDTTLRFVERLRAQTFREAHLVVVDDGSTDGTADAVRTAWPAADIVACDGNAWWAGALAAGCDFLREHGARAQDVVVFINDDVEFDPRFLSTALDEFLPLRRTLLLAHQVDAASGGDIDHGGGVHADLRRLRFRAAKDQSEVNCLPTRGLFVRWEDFESIGGFHPVELPHYLSDYEFTLRAKRIGFALRVASKAAVRVNATSTGPSLENLFERSRSGRFRLLFSPRFKDNPSTWSSFVTLAVPARWRPFLWLKVWLHFAVIVVRCAFTPVVHERR